MIKWKDDYSCYENSIDEQHKRMIDMINQMNEIAEMNDGHDRYDEIIEVFKGLTEYTEYHFSSEEKLFEKYSYGAFDTKIQKLEHKSFFHKVKAINLYDLEEDQTNTVRKVVEFLSKWLDQHILVTDKRFGEFLREINK